MPCVVLSSKSRIMTCVKYFQFSAAVRGFHYYRKSWLPEPEQTLNCFHEEGNTFDRFAIKVCEKDKNEIVGHLPMEISRFTKFLLDRGTNVSAKLTSTYYRRSPLVQGGIDIPCVVAMPMPGTVINQLLMERYKQLVETLYTEPKEEEILGTFLQLENTGEQDLAPVAPKQKKKPKCPPESDKNQKDIRSYFAATPAQATKKPETKKPKSPNVITID